MGSVAYASIPNTDVASVAAIPTDTARAATEDDTQTDGAHHRRFCVKLNAVLTRLVEQGVITREQKMRILAALGCPTPTTDRPASTDRPSTTRAATTRSIAAR
jgi:hypothetical protein